MARIKKFSPKENLTSFNTFIVDTGNNSDYFRITEFKDTFTGGKNGFLIEGSPYLKESTEIKMEILDVEGNPIYFEPGNGIPEYYEGISKLIAVYVYEDTPIGNAKISILGELKEYIDETGVVRQIPSEWQGVYNVKWEREFKVNRLIANEDRVRFYRRPQVNIDEIVKPIFSGNPPTTTQVGTVNGLPLVPTENTNLSNFTLPTSYRLKIDSGNGWTGSMQNQTVLFDNLNYSPRIDEVINETEIVVSPPYTENNIVKSFSGEDYSVTFTHLEGFSDLATALTGSFAKIKITDMKTFVGDAARVKVFRRSQSQITDYEFVQEIQLESNELLRDIETRQKTEETYGIFTQNILSEYWDVSDSELTTTFNQDFLYNSVKLSGSTGQYFFTTQSFDIQEGVEYTLDLNVRKETTNPNHSLRVFLSGSYNGSEKSQDIVSIDSSNFILQKTNFNENIIAENFDSASLYIEPNGSDWYINNVSLKASQETSFSPDEITFIQQVPKTLEAETFDYRFEFYDINNNFIPVNVEQTKTFVGGNLNLFQKSIDVTPDSLYFAFDSASNPANPLPPTVINFDVETNVITGSINYTSGAFDFFGNEIPSSEYVAGQYPGLLSNIEDRSGRFPFLTVQNFTGSRDDLTVQFIRYTAEVEGVSDTFVITRVEDGKGGVNFEIVPYRGTIIKNKESKTLEVQAIRIDGINRIELKDGLTRNFSDAKLHLASASLDGVNEVTTYVSLSQAITNPNFITGISAGTTGSGEIDYNAEFTRDAIDNELIVYLMDGPTSQSILTSLILTDLKDGLNNGVVSSLSDQFNIKYIPRETGNFNPSSSPVTASFQRRGTTLNPVSASLDIIPSSSIEPKTEIPHFYMFYVTGAFDDTITVAVTDYLGNRINSGVPGITPDVAYYDAVETKQLNLEFTYTEPITSASVTANKTFFITPDGLPGRDSINIDIEPSPVQIGANHKGDVYDYTVINPTIEVTQGDLFLIHTASGDPGTFTTSSVNGIVPTGITLSGSNGDAVTSTSMSLYGFSNMTALSASVTYNFDIYPYFTSSLVTQSRVQRFNKVIEGTSAIEVLLEPTTINFNADELGFVSQYNDANTELSVRQQEEYLTYDDTNSGTPGTYTASLVATNITIGDISASNQYGEVVGDDTLHIDNFSNMSATTASVVYNLTVYPYSLKNGVAGVPTNIKKKQIFTRTSDGSKARKVNLIASTNTVVYNGDGTQVAPEGNITLTANAINTTGSAFFEFLYDDNSTLQASSTFNEASIGGGDLPNTGSQSTFTVNLRDGSSNGTIVDSDAVTITGIREGSTVFSAQLSNPSTTVLVEVDGTIDVGNSTTEIHAYKGGTELQYVEEYDEEALDPITFLPIGTEGQFSASIFEISSFLTHRSGSIVEAPGELYGVSAGVSNWTTPQTNTSGYIIYKIDFENGRNTQYVQQSFSTVFEGAVGPGIVVRGEWTGSLEYLYTPQRRDVVIYRYDNAGTEETHYFATTDTLVTSSTQPYTTEPVYTPGMSEGTYDASNWEYLGEQDFFVAAKMAIFEESFVENTINVGIPQPGDGQNANIAIVGGTDEPYIAIGQNGTQGYAQPGVFLGLTRDGGPIGNAGTNGLMTLTGTPDGQGRYNSLEWNGETLTIRGALRQTAAGIVEASLRGLWAEDTIYYPDDIVSNEGQSWLMDGEPHTSSLSHEPGVGASYAESWSLNIPSGSSAQTMRLSTDSQTFRVAKDGTVTPTTITLTANRENIQDGTTFSTTPSVTLGGSGDSATLSYTDFSNGGTNTSVKVTATAGAFSDEITIVQLEEGSDALTIVNTNQAHLLPANASGEVSSYADSGTTIRIFEGITPLTFQTGPLSAGEYSVYATISPSSIPPYISVGSISGDETTTITVANHSGMDDAQDSVVITYTITGSVSNGNPFEIETTQTIAKAKTGASGSDGADGASGQAAGVTYAGSWTSPADITTYEDGVTYMGEDTLKYVVKYGSDYYVCATSHTYRGVYDGSTTYQSEDAASTYVPDVVRYLGVYYKVKAGQGPTTGISPSVSSPGNVFWDQIGGSITPGTWTDAWEAFGAQFTSVATDILFAEDVYANRTINIGTNEDNKPVIAINADSASGYQNPFISIGQSTPGFEEDGIFLGYSDTSASFSILSDVGAKVNIGGMNVDKEGLFFEETVELPPFTQVESQRLFMVDTGSGGPSDGTDGFTFPDEIVNFGLVNYGTGYYSVIGISSSFAVQLETGGAGYTPSITSWDIQYYSSSFEIPVGGPATKPNNPAIDNFGWRDDPVEHPEQATSETWFVNWSVNKSTTIGGYSFTYNSSTEGYNYLTLRTENLLQELGITDNEVAALRGDGNPFPSVGGGDGEHDTTAIYGLQPSGSMPILWIDTTQDADQNDVWHEGSRVGYQILDVVNSSNAVNTTGYDTLVVGKKVYPPSELATSDNFGSDFAAFEAAYNVGSAQNGIAVGGTPVAINTSLFKNIQISWVRRTTDTDINYTNTEMGIGFLQGNPIQLESIRIHSSGSNGNSRPYVSMGQLTQSYDENGVFMGYQAGSDIPVLSLKSSGNSLKWDGEILKIDGRIEGGGVFGTGSVVEGSGIYVPSQTSPSFSVDVDGNVTAESATIRGTIQATDGNIGDWVIDADTQALRDNNNEVVFDPNLPEIGLFNIDDGTKTVSIKPTGSLADPNASGTTISGIGTPSNYTNVTGINTFPPTYGAYSYSATGSAADTIPNGTYPLVFNMPTLTMSATTTTPVSSTVSAPNYFATSNGQMHGAPLQMRGSAGYEVWAELLDESGNVLQAQRLQIVNAYSSYQYGETYIAGDESGDDFGDFGFTSVTGDTLIHLADGTTKRADEIDENDWLLVWDEKNNKLVSHQIAEKRQRWVNEYYILRTKEREIKVSDTHGFYLDGGVEISIQDIIPNETEVYIYTDEGTMVKSLVLEVEYVNSTFDEIHVISFSTPPYKNYISDGILSHNYVTFPWVYNEETQFSSQSGATDGQSVTRNFTFDQGAITYKMRYKWRGQASAGQKTNTGQSLGSDTNIKVFQTSQATYTTGIGSLPTSVSISVPTNITEITGKGIQVLSGTNEYVRMERGAAGKNLVKIAGGNLVFGYDGDSSNYKIRPYESNRHDLGTSGERWRLIYSNQALNTSDRNLKKNILESDLGLPFINSLNPIKYHWLEDDNNSPYHYGLIAQEVDEVIPKESGSIVREDDGNWNMSYNQLISPMIKAIQQLSQKVSELESYISGSL